MQKIINVLALASTAVSIAVVGTGAYVYVNKDSIIESVTEKALGSLGGLGGGLGGDLPIGTPDLAPAAPDAATAASNFLSRASTSTSYFDIDAPLADTPAVPLNAMILYYGFSYLLGLILSPV